MHPLVIALGLAAWIAVRIITRRWIAHRWLDDRITDRQAALMFGVVSFAPLAALAIIAVAMQPAAAPVVILGILPAAVIVIGLTGAVMDYMTAQGIKQSMKQARNARRSS